MIGGKLSDTNGYIYLIAHPEAFKVGFSTNVARRLRHTQTHLHHELKIVLSIPGTFAAEQDFHARFKNESLGNEWYPASFQAAAVEYLKGLKVEMLPQVERSHSAAVKKPHNVHPKSIANLKTGRSKYGVTTQSIRVPVPLIPAIKSLIDDFVAARLEQQQADPGEE